MELGDMKEYIVTIAIIVMLGATLAIAITDFRGNIDTSSSSVVNESDGTNLIWGNNTDMTVDFVGVGISVSSISNCSGGDYSQVSPDNYTVTSSTGTIQCNTNSSWFPKDGDAMCINYSYIPMDSAYNISSNGLGGIKNSTEYIDTTGTIIGIAILIGVVVTAFTFLRR